MEAECEWSRSRGERMRIFLGICLLGHFLSLWLGNDISTTYRDLVVVM